MVCRKCHKHLDVVRVLQERVHYVDVNDNGITITPSALWIDREIVKQILEWDGIEAFKIPALFKHIRVSKDGTALVANGIDIQCPFCGASLLRKEDKEKDDFSIRDKRRESIGSPAPEVREYTDPDIIISR